MTIEAIATHCANEHINFHCLDLEHEAKLRRWQQVYDSLVAAQSFYRDHAVRRVWDHVSAN